VNVNGCVLRGENWTETEIPEMEVVSSVHEGTDFVAAGAAVRRRVGQLVAAGIVAVVTCVDGPVMVEWKALLVSRKAVFPRDWVMMPEIPAALGPKKETLPPRETVISVAVLVPAVLLLKKSKIPPTIKLWVAELLVIPLPLMKRSAPPKMVKV